MDIKAKVLRNLSYGLYLIGVMDGERPCGCIVNTVFQVTSENPIVAISMNKNNYTWELLEREGRFAVSILSEKTRKEVIQKLGFVSGRDHDKYEGIDYTMRDGLPVLNEQCCGALICKVVSVTETPTHMVVLASVAEAYELAATVPMTYRYYHEVIRGGAPKNAPSYIAPEKEEKENRQASAGRWVCDVCGYVYEGDLKYVFITGYDRNTSNLSVSTADAAAIFLDGTMATIDVNKGDVVNSGDTLVTLN